MHWKPKRSLATNWIAILSTFGLAAIATSASPLHATRKSALGSSSTTPAHGHEQASAREHVQHKGALVPAGSGFEPASASRFARLAPVQFFNINTRRRLSMQLYEPKGTVDESVAAQLDSLLCDARDKNHWKSTRLDRRMLQLVYRAAYHFSANEVQVVSAYRESVRRQQGMHAQGRAIDFRLPGVAAASLAAYLRTIPRVGVGVYTHPKTQFVHLDVREHSFHWLDASPPRRHWRERNISSRTLAALDATYSPASDWPEGLAR